MVKTEDIKRNYYAVIPAEVRFDEALSPNAKLLYGDISALCNQKGFCWATNSYFAKMYGCSRQYISKLVNELKSKGHIKVNMVYEEGSKRILQRCISVVDTCKPDDLHPVNHLEDTCKSNSLHPVNRELKDNTTYNNTKNNKFNKKSARKNKYKYSSHKNDDQYLKAMEHIRNKRRKEIIEED